MDDEGREKGDNMWEGAKYPSSEALTKWDGLFKVRIFRHKAGALTQAALGLITIAFFQQLRHVIRPREDSPFRQLRNTGKVPRNQYDHALNRNSIAI